MEPSQTSPVDWSDFSRKKTRAVIATICVPFAIFLPAVLLINKGYMPYIAIPVVIAALLVNIVFLRQLQVVICPKCGNAFMDQDENLFISRTAGWRILFRLKCLSCGAHRWMD